MRRNHLQIVQMISNYFNNKWNGANVECIKGELAAWGIFKRTGNVETV